MNSLCPKCASGLSPVSRERSLVGLVLSCPSCGGIWVSAEALGAESTHALLAEVDVPQPGRPEGDKHTGLCPEGHGIMRRARVSWEEPYFLERCAHCHGLWFDRGEWSKAASQSLMDDISRLWSSAYRREITAEHNQRELQQDMQLSLGAELYEAVNALASRLRGHPARSAVLAYLAETSKK